MYIPDNDTYVVWYIDFHAILRDLHSVRISIHICILNNDITRVRYTNYNINNNMQLNT